MAEGIEVRIATDGTRSYRASVWSNRDRKRIRKTFPSMAAAKGWRSDALTAVRRGTLSAPSRTTLRAACERWLEDAGAGIVTTRGGDTYKPAALASY
jgi:integrase